MTAKDIAKRIQKLADSHEMPLEPVKGQSAFRMDVQSEAGNWMLVAHYTTDDPDLRFYSMIPERVPEGRRAQVMELVTRVNYDSRVSTFELDLDDGELRLRTGTPLYDEGPSDELLLKLVEDNLDMMELYLPAIEAVIEGRLEPVEAIRFAEEAADEGDEGDA